MIALGILTTWLALTAAGFGGLSVLGRAGAREDSEAARSPSELQAHALADSRISTPRVLAR